MFQLYYLISVTLFHKHFTEIHVFLNNFETMERLKGILNCIIVENFVR